MKRFSETQSVSTPKQYEGGREPMELCREYRISTPTLYNWRKKYSGVD
jgi:putative transposase